MARLAQVAPLGRLAWWTLSLPSLLSLGRLGREVANISDLSKQSPHVRCWHKADVPLASTNVSWWGNSGHVLEIPPLPLLTDPQRTFALHDDLTTFNQVASNDP